MLKNYGCILDVSVMHIIFGFQNIVGPWFIFNVIYSCNKLQKIVNSLEKAYDLVIVSLNLRSEVEATSIRGFLKVCTKGDLDAHKKQWADTRVQEELARWAIHKWIIVDAYRCEFLFYVVDGIDVCG